VNNNNYETIDNATTFDDLFSYLPFLNSLSDEEKEELRICVVSLMASFYDTGFDDGCTYKEEMMQINSLMNQCLYRVSGKQEHQSH
jgi:hypothetical protein